MRDRPGPAQSWSAISSDEASIQWASSIAISSGPARPRANASAAARTSRRGSSIAAVSRSRSRSSVRACRARSGASGPNQSAIASSGSPAAGSARRSLSIATARLSNGVLRPDSDPVSSTVRAAPMPERARNAAASVDLPAPGSAVTTARTVSPASARLQTPSSVASSASRPASAAASRRNTVALLARPVTWNASTGSRTPFSSFRPSGRRWNDASTSARVWALMTTPLAGACCSRRAAMFGVTPVSA